MSDKPIIYEDEDGAVTIRASALGMCERIFWAVTQGIRAEPFSQETLDIFAEGHRLEEVMMERLNADGYDLRGSQDEQELWIIPTKLKVKGHVDGIFYDPDTGEATDVWENKALGESTYKEFLKKGPAYSETYKWQISVYMATTGLPSTYTAIRRFSPTEKTETPALNQDRAPYNIKEIAEPYYSLNDIKKRAISIYKIYKSMTPDMPPCVGSYFCDYKQLHDEAEEQFVPTRSNPKFDELAAALTKARADKKEAEEEEKRIKGQIELLAPDDMTEILEGQLVQIEKTKVERRYDDKAKIMEALGVDEEEYKEKYQRPGSYITYKVKKKGPKW